MTDNYEHVHIPNDFFSKTLKEYQNWYSAWFRETAQNACDAGATQIDFSIIEQKNSIKLIVKDNGHGLSQNSLINGLLTLGGSIKQKVDKSIGGFGYAKHIILFAHHKYQITTQEFQVTGSGIHYTIKSTNEFLKGTEITVQMDKIIKQSELKQYCRQLIRHYQTDIRFSLNGKTIRSAFCEYDFDFETDLGRLQFSEEEGENDVSIWIRVNGLPMFRYQAINRCHKGCIGTLDLSGHTTELLTTNRDALNYEASEALDLLIDELIEQPQWFKQQHELKIIFNPINDQTGKPNIDVTEVLPFCVPQTLAMNKKLIAVINQLQVPELVITYPDHFYLYITPILLRREHYQPQQITLPVVKNSLNLKRTQILAWCWYYAVYWILKTDFVHSCLDIEFDTDRDCYIIHESDEEHLIVSIGFIFNEEVQGVNIRSDTDIKILINPECIDTYWYIGDVLDVAIHECAHCIALKHDEMFNEVELQIRRDLRRTIDEDFILVDAQEMLDEMKLIISNK